MIFTRDLLDPKRCKGLVSIMFVRWRSQWAMVYTSQGASPDRLRDWPIHAPQGS